MIEGKMMNEPQKAREQGIGPFTYDDAIELIQTFARGLTNLGLNGRFVMNPIPRAIVEVEKRGDRKTRRRQISYQVVLIDKRPDDPRPEGLAAFHIANAAAQGYAKPQFRPYAETSAAQPRTDDGYEAFGQIKTLNQWAKAVGVTYPTLKSRIDRGMTVKEAITEIAVKKAA